MPPADHACGRAYVGRPSTHGDTPRTPSYSHDSTRPHFSLSDSSAACRATRYPSASPPTPSSLRPLPRVSTYLSPPFTSRPPSLLFFFFFNDPAPPEISPLPLPAPLPI